MSIAIFIVQIVIILVIAFLSCYFKEKGKNIATKEDIGKITTEIEKVKHEYSSKLESVKSVLGARLFTHQVRYQNEFNMLVNLSEKLYKFSSALINFELHVASLDMDSGDPNHTKQIVEKVVAAMGALGEEYESHLPFYPKDIYDNVQKIHGLGNNKFIVQANNANLTGKDKLSEMAIEIAKEQKQSLDSEEMSDIIDKIHEAIRKRVKYWEQLDIEH